MAPTRARERGLEAHQLPRHRRDNGGLAHRRPRPIECQRTIFSLDTAFKTGLSNDYSVIMVISEAKNGFYIRLVSRERLKFPDLKRKAEALADIWRPTAVLIEDAASGQSLIQALKSETRLPILPGETTGR
jgi:phage terminase large subunit-like protein